MEKAPPTKRLRYDAALPRRSPAPGQRKPFDAGRRPRLKYIDTKRLYAWQKAAQPPLPADPAEAAEVRTLRAANKRLAQELDILKKAIASAC